MNRWLSVIALGFGFLAVVISLVALGVARKPGEAAVRRREEALIDHYYPKFQGMLKGANVYREKPETLEELFDPFVDLMGQIARTGF